MQTVLNEFKKQFDIDDLQKKEATLPWCGVCTERSLNWNQRRTSHENIAIVKVRGPEPEDSGNREDGLENFEGAL